MNIRFRCGIHGTGDNPHCCAQVVPVCKVCGHDVASHGKIFGCALCSCVHSMNTLWDKQKKDDPVNHPSHYTAYKGLEIIDLTEQMNFNRGNAVKYIARAGLKNPETELQDLEKAQWYISREIDRLKKNPDDIP